ERDFVFSLLFCDLQFMSLTSYGLLDPALFICAIALRAT
ncbi:hypothetical protein SAMN06265374_0162, partial [Roseibium denhamense]